MYYGIHENSLMAPSLKTSKLICKYFESTLSIYALVALGFHIRRCPVFDEYWARIASKPFVMSQIIIQ